MDRHVNKHGTGKGGFAPLFHIVRSWFPLPDRERSTMVKSYLSIIALLGSGFLLGCRTLPSVSAPHELLSHDVSIPRGFRCGDGWPGLDGDAKRYVDFYESGWWDCVEAFSEDIAFVPSDADRGNACGWPSEQTGYWNGYSDAERRIRLIVGRLGKPDAQIVLRKSLRTPEEEHR
jgi:hypothetical protein